MCEICGQTISMNDDGIYGFETLMYMTSQLSRSGSCNLTFEKRRDYDYLHLFFTDAKISDCDGMTLYINEGDNIRSTVGHVGIPRVCGPTTAGLVGNHYSSFKQYLALRLAWDPVSKFRGTVFRLVANTYMCKTKCDSGQAKCEYGPCIYAYLDATSGHDFCGGSLLCTGIGNGDGTIPAAIWGIFGSVVTIILVVVFVCVVCLVRLHVQDIVECFCGLCSSCKRGCERCCECMRQGLSDTKERLTVCYGRTTDSCGETGGQPVGTTLPPTSVLTEATPNNVTNSNYDTSSFNEYDVEVLDGGVGTDDSWTDNEFESYNYIVDGVVTGDSSAPSPSYSAAMRTRPLPPAPSAPPTDDPPCYDAAADNPAFEPPDYGMVMANKTFYGAKSVRL